MRERLLRTGTVLCSLALLAAGCSSPDRDSLAQLFEQIQAEVTGKPRPEITDMPAGQRSVTFFRDQSRDAYIVADTFLKSGARLTDGAREDVVCWRDAEKRAYEYYDTFIQGEDFELSESEKAEGRELLDAALGAMRKLAERIDGKR